MALSPPIPQGTLIRLRRNQAMPTIYDVEMEGIDQLKQYDRVECHTVLYPYSRKVSSEDISFYPFEEYVSDLVSHQRSAYAEIHSPSAQVCGLLLGGIIALVFAIVKPDEFLSIQSLVSILAAYAIGKEFWDDIERALIDLSRNWRLRVADVIYRYQLEKDTTLSAYFFLAKQRRYGKLPLLPDKMDFVKQSNSQTLRMCFARRDLAAFADASAHVHSIHIDPALLPELEGSGFMFGVKVSLGRTRWGITRNLELFQCIDETSTDQASIGCLDGQGNWVEGALFYRNTLTCGRISTISTRGWFVGGRSWRRQQSRTDPERRHPWPQTRPRRRESAAESSSRPACSAQWAQCWAHALPAAGLLLRIHPQATVRQEGQRWHRSSPHWAPGKQAIWG